MPVSLLANSRYRVQMKVFFDTMVFLHYKSLDELDVVDVLGPPPHTVLVPRVTLRELDKHKDGMRRWP